MACWLLLLSGCTETGVTAQEPVLVVPSDALDFGEVVRGTRVTLRFEALNEGGGVLHFDEIALTDASDPAFSLEDPGADRVEPGEGLTLSVSYAPDEIGVDQGELELLSDDPERPTRRIGLSGEGVDPRVDVDPEALWFGELAVGESRALGVDVLARGQGWLNIREIFLEDPSGAYSFSLPDEVALPQRLSPGTGFALEVVFSPVDEAPAEAELHLLTNDPEQPTAVVRLLGNVEGDGLGPPEVEILSPDWGNHLIAGEAVTLRGVALDDADPPQNLLCAWYADGQLLGAVTPASDGRVELVTTALTPGQRVLSLRAVDGAGGTASDEVEVTVWDADEPVRYVVSGGPSVFDWFTVDDDLTIEVDGQVVFQDTNHSQDAHQPVSFEARAGQTLRIIANDVNACQKRISPLTLHFGTGTSQPLNEAVCVSSCAQDACYEEDYAGPWPNVFLDESHEINIP